MRHCFSPVRLLGTLVRVGAIVVAVGAAVTVAAQGPMSVAPSGRATTEVALTPAEKTEGAAAKALVVRIDYGQPHLRGRQLHTGDLVPYDEPWRLGANAATTLMTDVDLAIGGSHLPKGTYVLRALPTRAAWTLLVEKDTGQSPMGPGSGDKPADVVARIDLRQTTLQSPLESLTMWLIPSTKPGPAHGELRFAWGTTQLSTDWSTR